MGGVVREGGTLLCLLQCPYHQEQQAARTVLKKDLADKRNKWTRLV